MGKVQRRLRHPGLALSLGTLVIALAACGVDRGGYVAANEALLAEVPAYPDARQIEKTHNPYSPDNEFFPRTKGYTTNVTIRIAASIREVHDFYLRELPPLGWTLVRRQPEGLSFRQGAAIFVVMTTPPGPEGSVPIGTNRPATATVSGPASGPGPTAPPPPEVLVVRYEDRLYGFEIAVDHDSYRYRD
jgi:hypothetical protein